ncbi:MAG: hypothetical protein AAFV59_13735 [Pseudomonadota bacterium]
MFAKWSCLALASCTFGAWAIAECPPPVLVNDIEVFPSAERLPENILRFYLYFPRPMARDISSADIQLVDFEGEDVLQAFLPMRYELWSSDRRRLTLILDPGRVKTSLKAHETHGRALKAGNRFELRVFRGMKDANGCALDADVSFGFSVQAAELESLKPETWSIDVPAAGSRAALQVDLGRPHDHLSMAYRIRISSEDGQPIAGRIGLEAEERIWTFVPNGPWMAAPHKISIDERLEDLAGNRPGVVFDRAADAPMTDWVREIIFVPQSEN